MELWRCFLCTTLSESVLFFLCIAAARRLDGKINLCLRRGQKVFWMFLCVGNSFLIVLLPVWKHGMTERGAVLLGIAAGGLLFACLTDTKYCKVYDFAWWPVLLAGALLMWQTSERWSPVWVQFVCFLLLQRFLFGRFYGMADVYAFCACGLWESVFGLGLLGYLLHMAVAFLLLAVVQGVKRNIETNGNLKRPVPFLPYIVFSFWIVLLLARV